jgi:ABC-type multidrug transport system fused ATPase/permease subunit
MTGVTFTSPILASVLTFVVYALTGNDLNPPVVFSSIALFNALRMPLMMLPLVITGATDAWVSLQRIQALLLAPELGGDTLGKPDVPGKVDVKAGEYIWEAPVKLLPDPPKRRGGPPAMAGGGTMRRGAYGGTTVLPGASQEASGFSGWMQRTFKGASSTRAASSGTSSATEMAAKRAVRAADAPSPNGLNSPSPEGAPFTGLHDISLSVAPGELLAIVGRVGSGKSSLLSALVGEMKRTSGTGGIGGTVSFCPQSPWIQNATGLSPLSDSARAFTNLCLIPSVRDNVLFGLPYDEAKYWDAVRVAALERDLEILPDGDFTEIGERGIVSIRHRSRVRRQVVDRLFYSDPFRRSKSTGQLGEGGLCECGLRAS